MSIACLWKAELHLKRFLTQSSVLLQEGGGSYAASFCAICNRTKSLAEDFCCQTPLLQALLLGIH